MDNCRMPRLLEECYQEGQGLGEELHEVGLYWGKILKNLLFRCICCVLIALGLFGLKYNGEGNQNFMYMTYLLFIVVGLSPLRHCKDKVCFHEYGIVYYGLIRKKEYFFAKWKPFMWASSLTIRGVRRELLGEKIELFPFDYTYIKNFYDNFLYLYLNNIEIGESMSETKQWPYVDTEESALELMVRSTYQGEDQLNIVYASYPDIGRSVIDHYYAIGIGENDLFVMPFIAGKVNVSYGKGYLYRKKTLGYIKRNGSNHRNQYYEIYGKDKKFLFRFFVHVKNTKTIGNECLNIVQEQQAQIFHDRMTRWMEEVNSLG